MDATSTSSGGWSLGAAQDNPLLASPMYHSSSVADKAIEFELFGKVIGLAKQAGAEDFMLATGIEKSETGAKNSVQ